MWNGSNVLVNRLYLDSIVSTEFKFLQICNLILLSYTCNIFSIFNQLVKFFIRVKKDSIEMVLFQSLL